MKPYVPFLVASIAVTGCGTQSALPNTDGPAVDASPIDVPFGDIGGPTDRMGPDTNIGDSSGEPAADAPPPSTCHTLKDTAPVITSRKVAADMPTAVGGTLVDGTYYETDFTIYTGPGGETGPGMGTHQLTAHVSGSTMEIVEPDGGAGETRETMSIVTSGANIHLAYQCPAGGGFNDHQYDATINTIVIYVYVDRFTQPYSFTLTRQM